MHKVKDHVNLVRDPKNQAILNTDREKLMDLKNKKQMKDSIQHINEELDTLKKDFREIKELLQQIACRG
jgi:prefoldin subunit 5